MTDEYVTIERPGYPKVVIHLNDWARIMSCAHGQLRIMTATEENRVFQEKLDFMDTTLGAWDVKE